LFLGSECRKTWTIDPYQYSATHLWTPPAWTAPLYPLVPTEGVLNSTLQCSPGGIYNHCSDKLLGIDFDISSSLGKIDTQLKMGGYCGYAYDYSFPAQATQPKTSTWAGGRSWDFSEGRGGWFTDYYGWGSSSAEVACSWYPDTFCQIIRPEVIFKIYLPTAEDFCTSGPYSGPDAMGIVNVNLPENQAVNGFTFVSRLLSDRDQQALNAILGYSDQGNSPQCDAEHIQQYEAKRNAILQYFREGQGMPFDRETLDNIERILQIARSIKIR
jgi:hypothetical protein